MMNFEFDNNTIYDTVGQLLQSFRSCIGLKQSTGIKHRILFKLYDNKGNLINEYSGFYKGWPKLIKKDMHNIQRGTIKLICEPSHY